jgi:SAM-dependent methyltransferase
VTNPHAHSQQPVTPGAEAPVRRLNWGAGEHTAPGWINSDIKEAPDIDISCDLLDGLPLESASIDYVVSQHSLPEIPLMDLPVALEELRRVLKPGGVLRLSLPDLDKGIKAYVENDLDYFLISDQDAATIGGKFVTQLLWYGWSRTLFTHDFTDELLRKASFREVQACSFRETKSRFPEIVDLDTRERESFFVEATK